MPPRPRKPMISRWGKSLDTSAAESGGSGGRLVATVPSGPSSLLSILVSTDKFKAMRQRGHNPSGAPGGRLPPHWLHLGDAVFISSIALYIRGIRAQLQD